jgi:hypothetical protein
LRSVFMVELVSRCWIVLMKFYLVCDMFTLGVYRSTVIFCWEVNIVIYLLMYVPASYCKYDMNLMYVQQSTD